MATYTLFSQQATGTSAAADTADYTFGVQFTVSVSATLTAMWFYSPSGVTVLPNLIVLYTVTGAALIHQESSPANFSWSGAAGSGWIRAPFATPQSLTAATNYKAAVGQNVSSTKNWYSATANYWSSGAGSGGITSGPLSAPNNAGATQGQDTFNTSVPAYPNTAFNAANYWVDLEITAASPAGSTKYQTGSAVPALIASAI